MWCVALLLLGLASQEVHTESWPGGTPRVRCEVELDLDGTEVRHGHYQSFRENGALESEGDFEHGAESGPWTFYHPDGTRAASGRFADGLKSGPWETFFPDGTPESKGSYVRGAMDGRWSFWRADGAKDLRASGLYRIQVARSSAGGLQHRGYLVDGLREGAWTSTWPDGSVQLEGQYSGGRRSGTWVFHHPDGVPSTLLVSGVFEDGARTGPAPSDEPPRFDPDAFPPLEPWAGGAPEDPARIERLVDAWLGGAAPEPADEGLLASAGVCALPLALEPLLRLDPEAPADRLALGLLESGVLGPLCGGHVLTAFGADGPPDAAGARELVRAWLSLWALTHADTAFWERVAAADADRPGQRRVLQDPPLLGEEEAGAAPTELEASAGPRAPYRLRFGKEKERCLRHAPPGTKECIARALEWLVAHQSDDGHWSNAGFAAECGELGRGPCTAPGAAGHDVGATGLALLCLLGDGHTLDAGEHRTSVARGLAWLVQQQASGEGLIGSRAQFDFIYDHAIATTALCEAYGLGSEALRVPAERALAFLELGQSPQGGWRYDVPAIDGGDTSVTGWTLGALVAGRDAGLAVNPAALEAVLGWIESMTEASTGRVGYNFRGELSSRNSANESYPRDRSEPLTAVGLLCRLRLGQRPGEHPILMAHAQLVLSRPPAVDKVWGGDQYHWYYGTLALHELGGPLWDRWEVELRKVVILSQVRRADAEGSWDPIGPWAAPMGRVCTTALLTLGLECFYRYPRVLDDEAGR